MREGDAVEELRMRGAGLGDDWDFWRFEEGEDGVHEVGVVAVD